MGAATPLSRCASASNFIDEAAMRTTRIEDLSDSSMDDLREELIAWIERIGDQLREADEAILEARSLNDDRDAPPRWLRAWPKPSGGSLQQMAQRHLDLAILRYANASHVEDELQVLQIYVEEAGRRMWKLNHAYDASAQRAVLSSQLQRLADAYANPPAIGRERIDEP